MLCPLSTVGGSFKFSKMQLVYITQYIAWGWVYLNFPKCSQYICTNCMKFPKNVNIFSKTCDFQSFFEKVSACGGQFLKFFRKLKKNLKIFSKQFSIFFYFSKCVNFSLKNAFQWSILGWVLDFRPKCSQYICTNCIYSL